MSLDTRSEGRRENISSALRSVLARMVRHRQHTRAEQEREELRRARKMLISPTIRHLTGEIRMLMRQMAELEDTREQCRAQDREQGIAWREHDLDMRIGAIRRTIEHVGTAVVRITRAKSDARQRVYAARSRSRVGSARIRRVHRHTRSRRVVRVAPKATSTGDPADPDGPPRPRAPRSSAGGVA